MPVPYKRISKKPQGRTSNTASVEELFSKIFDANVIQGLSYRKTAELLGVDINTIKYHCIKVPSRKKSGQFIEWMKTAYPERYDKDELVKRFMIRSEARRTDAYIEFLKGEKSDERLKAIKEIRAEDESQIKLMQDIGVVEAKSEVHTQVPITFTWGVPPQKEN